MQDRISLIRYKDVTLIFESSRIIGVFEEGVNFIKNVSSERKSEVIYILKKLNYINEDLSEYLLSKTSSPVTGFITIKSPSRIHLREYKHSGSIIVYKKESIIGIFQDHELDLMDDVLISEDVRSNIMEKLKKSNYL